VPSLTDLLRDADLETRKNAASALESIGTGAKPATLDLIFAMLHDKDLGMRINATAALQAVAPAPELGGPAFRHALRDKAPAIRDVANEALVKFGAKALPSLRDALKDKDPDVKRLAAEILAKIGAAAKPAIPDLKEAAKDPNPMVKDAVQKALTTLGG
jgi:HEAT repeat protein